VLVTGPMHGWLQSSGPRAHGAAKRAEKKKKGRERKKKERGTKRTFPSILSPQKQKINILLTVVPKSKFDNNDSVHQQTTLFCMSTSKDGHFECPVANFVFLKMNK